MKDVIRCIVEKDGKRTEVEARRKSFDAKTDEITFPPYLYEGDGFTVLAMEGEPDFESLSMN